MQRIEQKMRHLERGAGKLLMRIERGGIRVVGHAQSLGLAATWTRQQERDDHGKRRRPAWVSMSPETHVLVHTLCLR